MILITGGCSFSECVSPWINTWPRQLSSMLPRYKHISTGMGAQGNGLISRRIIYEVGEALKIHNNEDIIVGIMWSGPSRYDFYSQHKSVKTDDDGYMENPTKFIPDSKGSWTIMSHYLDSPADVYYRYFHDMVGQYIYSCEHILRTQWFLNLHKIKYFMTTYTSEVFKQTDHPDIKHLYDQIDFDHFLPIIGEYEWCRIHSGLEFPVPGDKHPSSEQHNLFTQQVIIPFLQQKGYI